MQNKEVNKLEDLKWRTKNYALRIIKLYSSLPKKMEMQAIGKQILRSGTSVGANYRESCRARSTQEFVAKLGISLQELEETAYWLELLIEIDHFKKDEIDLILRETDELMAIFVSSINTAKRKNNK
jgi:four helix bundle protein